MSNDAPSLTHADLPSRGRDRAVGSTLPTGPYRSTPVFDETTLPQALQRTHTTKAGAWGMLCILAGSIDFVDESRGWTMHALKAGDEHPILPQAEHHLVLTGPVQLRVDFYAYDPQEYDPQEDAQA